MSKKNRKQLATTNQPTKFLLYTTPSGEIKIDVLLRNENIWMPQKKMAELFAVNIPAISKHLKNIFKDGELKEESVVSILEITANYPKQTSL